MSTKKLIRILISPILFIVLVLGLLIGLSELCFFLGLLQLLSKVFQDSLSDHKKSESYEEIFDLMFIGIIYPFKSSKHFINTGKILQ